MYSRFVNWFSATRFGTWVVRHIASPLDPLVFRLTNGRLTSSLKPTLPMLTLTVAGARSGKPRTVQLAYHADGGDYLVVASAMGQDRHPGWKYNLDAHPDVEVRVRGRTFRAHASMLPPDEKQALWPAIRETIPQMKTYVHRTDRDFCVYRLREEESAA